MHAALSEDSVARETSQRRGRSMQSATRVKRSDYRRHEFLLLE